jgi:hypothetical protein
LTEGEDPNVDAPVAPPDKGPDPAGRPAPTAASPFSRALLQTLPAARDYRHWVDEAQQFASGQSLDPSVQRFAVQGPLGQPVLTPAGGAVPLRLLVSDYYRRLHTLDLGADLAALPVLNRPDDAITHAALLVRRARLKREAGGGDGIETGDPERAMKADADDALKLLEEFKARASQQDLLRVRPIPQDLVPVYVLVRSWAIDLRDGPAAAAEDLRGWIARPDLGKVATPEVTRRLVEFTTAAVRQDAARLIRDSRAAIRAGGAGGTAEDALRKLEVEIQGPLDEIPVVPVER